MKRHVLLWVGIITSAVFLYIALRDIQFREFLLELHDIRTGPVLLAFLGLLVVYAIRTVRWRTIIRAKAEIGFWSTFSTLMIGFFGNNVLPARAGEFVRAFLLRRQINVSKSYALGTIVVERVTDVAALIGLLLLALYRIPEEQLPAVTREVRTLALIVLGVFVVALAVMLWWRERIVGILKRLFRLVTSDERAALLASMFDRFSQGLEVLRNPRQLLIVGGCAVLSWAGMAIVFTLVFSAFRFDLPLSAGAFTVGLVNLGMIVPSSPGYVGTYEFFIKKTLGVFGITSGAAIAFALVTRLLWYLFEVVVGFVCLWYSHFPIKQIVSAVRNRDIADAGAES